MASFPILLSFFAVIINIESQYPPPYPPPQSQCLPQAQSYPPPQLQHQVQLPPTPPPNYQHFLPAISCPEMFSYRYNTTSNTVFGYLIVPVFNSPSKYVLETNMSVNTQVNQQDGLEILVLSSQEDILSGKPIHYGINFPHVPMIPKLTQVKFNGQIICSAPSDPIGIHGAQSAMWAKSTLLTQDANKPNGNNGGYPPNGNNGGYPPIGSDGGYPPNGNNGGYPPNGNNGGYPPNGNNGGYTPNGSNGGYPPNGNNGGYTPNGNNGGYPPNGNNGGYTPNGNNGGYPPNGNNEGYPHNASTSGGYYPPNSNSEGYYPPHGGNGGYHLLPPNKEGNSNANKGGYSFDANNPSPTSSSNGQLAEIDNEYDARGPDPVKLVDNDGTPMIRKPGSKPLTE